ncbi:MAG TPA: hypothetical protein VEX64_11170 [Pyrinomonadaceae bacterium]|jgi:hypothetical protein|nr:hypothetical protein [Pyrinomonadaceae bacterium]
MLFLTKANAQSSGVNSHLTIVHSRMTGGNSLSDNAEAENSASAQKFGVKFYEG